MSKPCQNRAVLDAGTKVLASDRPSVLKSPVFGQITMHPNSQITRVWEEHSVVELDESDFSRQVGDVVEVVPNHACVVTNLANYWFGVRDGIVEEINDVPARGLVE